MPLLNDTFARDPHAPRFVFALAQPAAATWLKADIAKRHPSLRFAFSRPGLYTFKVTESSAALAANFRLDSVFARHWGFSLGQASGAREVLELVLSSTTSSGTSPARKRLRLFVSERDEGEQPTSEGRALALRTELLTLAPELFEVGVTPAVGDWVLDLVVPPSEGEPCFVGYHRHDATHGKVPGGVLRIAPPADAPSRAYSKLREALAWSELPLQEGDHAVEIGCAPGGAVLALIERGVNVTGIDPAAMAPQIERHVVSGAFVHLQRPVGEIKREELPKRAQWLLSDANLAPQTALRYVTRIAKLLRPHLKGIVFTIKLNDDKVLASLPELLTALGRLSNGSGHSSVRAIQLPSHRREVVVVIRV